MKMKGQRDQSSGGVCLICGEMLEYSLYANPVVCRICGIQQESPIACRQGHYVCADCHGQEYYDFLAGFALTQTSQDPLAIAENMLNEETLPEIGAEHHAIPAAALLAALRNYGEFKLPGGDEVRLIGPEDIREGIRRTRQIAPCACAYFGACGAALAVGSVFSIIFQANCMRDEERSQALRASHAALGCIANAGGASCCKQSVRSSVLVGWQLLKETLHVYLPLSRTKCLFQMRNENCKGAACSFWRS